MKYFRSENTVLILDRNKQPMNLCKEVSLYFTYILYGNAIKHLLHKIS